MQQSVAIGSYARATQLRTHPLKLVVLLGCELIELRLNGGNSSKLDVQRVFHPEQELLVPIQPRDHGFNNRFDQRFDDRLDQRFDERDGDRATGTAARAGFLRATAGSLLDQTLILQAQADDLQRIRRPQNCRQKHFV